YDTPNLSAENSLRHLENVDKFENALNLNAKERSRRFASIDSNQNIHKVREAIRKRSVSMFEPRPELGHSTNALCFIGKRNLTKGVFLDRRAFMNSYDYKTDPDGKKLLGVIRPIPPVCGGINLEYYFSRVDNYKLGSGTKLPHNVMGLIGVANSSDGDLRAGLPLQMIEVHDPIRLLVMVEHHPDIILNTIKQEKSLYEWFAKGWVHLVAIDPEDHQFYYFKNDRFELYQPTASSIGTLHDIHSLIETANDIDTVHITEATRQNLPVQLIKH
ncbi:MAG TPA: Na-translocating system protein MpsB, partial [Saprospiraceae bacterium]|nr:Na-translocating system protein MpsB [Saprospiraceae bacterium]